MNAVRKDILVIEDADRWAETFSDILKGMGHNPILVFKDALEELTRRRVDLVIHDLCLDQVEFNGHCQSFLDKLHRAAPETPIVVSTERSVLGDAVFHLRDFGVHEYIFKGTFDLKHFENAVTRLLEGWPHTGLSRKQGELLLRLIAYGPLKLNGLTEELNSSSPLLLGEPLYKSNLNKSNELAELVDRNLIVMRGRIHCITSDGNWLVKKVFPSEFEVATQHLAKKRS